VSGFMVQLQPTGEGLAEVVGPVEAVLAAGRSSQRVSVEKNHRRVGSIDFVTVLELDEGVGKGSAQPGTGGKASIHCGHVGRRECPAAVAVRPSGLAWLRPVNGRS
jgi:hypothetical protein